MYIADALSRAYLAVSADRVTSSASEQDKSNPALWLATRVIRMELSYLLGNTRRVPQKKIFPKRYNKSFTDQACFCVFMDLDFVSVHKHAKQELGQYPAILTSHLVNNTNMFYRMNQGSSDQ